MNTYIKKSLEDVVPYKAVYREEGIHLDANENTAIPLYTMREHMSKWLLEMPINRYPDSDTTELRLCIAKAYNVSQEQVICGVGSDQLIDLLLRSVLEPGDLVISPVPSFSMYALTTHINGGVFKGIPLTEDFNYDFERFYEEIKNTQPKVTFICNPNNPTGCILTLDEIEHLTQVATGVVVVDEAYVEFGGDSAVGLVSQYANLLVLRTFSKAYGLAGARVGYGIGSLSLIETLLTVKAPYHLNSFSQEIATWVISHRDAFEACINGIRSERDRVYDVLKQGGYSVYPSYGNFIWMKAHEDIGQVLEEQGIYIKTFNYNATAYYRISIGTSEENNQLLTIFKGGIS